LLPSERRLTEKPGRDKGKSRSSKNRQALI
jgi:hypothetical protein